MREKPHRACGNEVDLKRPKQTMGKGWQEVGVLL